ncbi:MAG TPA: serine hydroxymethyltransferase [Candidatus Cryosericum sp.]|nr:serine hydroxymethyltransferase [Candidatus Cryosericum sp.]HPS69749.1 serine hydroxymethyltransferase [Candidatus Cryosericum sp.]
MTSLDRVDPEVADILNRELHREQNNIELIASENFVSPEVLAAQGSVLTNKYAEGYPGKRYYGGCEYVDMVETLAIERARALFGAEGANVQPHSGTQANLEVYAAVLQPGDTILSMSLADGGHLSHGSPVSLTGKLYRIVSYGVRRDTETIDYDQVRTLALAEHPKLILAGASAYPRLIDYAAFREIADAVGAVLMVDMAHIAGLVAARLIPSPVPYADFVTTTTHKTLRGPRGGVILFREQYAKQLNSAVFPGSQGGPLEHIIAAKAVAFKEAASPEFIVYQQQVLQNAKVLAEALAERGYRIVSGGTDNHLMLVDLTSKGVTGKDVQTLLESVGITVNKNAIPFDPLPPSKASGIRVGTPATTTRGMREAEMRETAALIDEAIMNRTDEARLAELRGRVSALTAKFPIYTGLAY